MTIYAKLVAVITATAILIVVSGLLVGSHFLTRHMGEAIERDMMIVVDIADEYVAAEIKLLELQAAEVARKVGQSLKAGEGEGALERALAEHPAFTGLAVFDGMALRDARGEPPVPPDLAGKPFLDTARAGGQAVSTTMHAPDGTLAMYVSAPMDGGLVLAAALPGQYFSDLLSGFTVYRTGHLFIDDGDGYIIANRRREWVRRRMNFLERSRADDRYRDMGAMVARGIAGEQGTARYVVDGAQRICAFRPISSPGEDWFEGLVAPLAESPLREIPAGMLMIGAITLALSVVAALLAAGLLRRPYDEMDRLRAASVNASEAKSAFLATMSHEIRTPLNVVVGLSELTLDEKGLAPEAASNLEKISAAGATILAIVNDILDIS